MKNDKLYTVKVYYTTGDSFSTYDDEEIIGMCWRNKDLAEQAVREIKEHNDVFTEFGTSDKKKIEKASNFPWYNVEHSLLLESDDGERNMVDAFWYGYFEDLHYVEVVECDD